MSQQHSPAEAAEFHDPPPGKEATAPLGRFGRVGADDRRLEAYAECNAVNSMIGTALSSSAGSLATDVVQMLASVQNDLFDLTSGLIDEPGEDGLPPARITDEHIARLDRAVEHYGQDLEPLQGFALPGGTMTAALLYQAQVAVGRAERALWTVVAEHPGDVDRLAPRFLGRVNRLLGILARSANAEFGDTTWRPMASVTVPDDLGQ